MARPAAPAPAPAAPARAPVPAARKDPFGLDVAAPAAAPEDDWSDVDMAAEPAALAPPVPSLDLEPEPLHAARPAAPAPIEIAEEPPQALELAPMHELVPPPAATGHQPAADGGEALLRDALSQASREVIERVVWEVVPQLAETIIRENLERLVKSRPA